MYRTDERRIRESLEALPETMQEFLLKTAERSSGDGDFYNGVVMGDCPVCGSFNTRDGSDTPLGDPTVGICLDCYTIACLECGNVFDKGQTVCEHRRICDGCGLAKEGDGCGVPTWECSFIQAWKESFSDKE
jgi:hypothetical protein